MNVDLCQFDESAALCCDVGGWIGLRQTISHREINPEAILAQRAVLRVGNRRLSVESGQLVVRGELRNHDHLLSVAEVRERLLGRQRPVQTDCTAENVGVVLADTGWSWKQIATESNDDPTSETTPADVPPHDPPPNALFQRGSGTSDIWNAAIPIKTDRCLVQVKAVDGGVEVTASMGSWETLVDNTTRQAIARFLWAAQGRLRFARYLFRNDRVFAVSFAVGDRWELELPDSVLAVVAACDLVGREVGALIDVEVAKVYLESPMAAS